MKTGRRQMGAVSMDYLRRGVPACDETYKTVLMSLGNSGLAHFLRYMARVTAGVGNLSRRCCRTRHVGARSAGARRG